MNNEALFKKYNKLVHKASNKYRRSIKGVPTYSYEDIYQMASIGFLEACNQYDNSKGIPFQVYANKRMHWYINNSLRNKRKMVKYPFYYEEVWKLASKYHLYHDDDDMRKLAEISKYTYKQVNNAMKCYDDNSITYLDKELEDGTTLYDMISGATFDESTAVVDEYLESLTDKQRQVVNLLLEGKNQVEIGKELGISQQHVSRIVKSLQKAWLDNYE